MLSKEDLLSNFDGIVTDKKLSKNRLSKFVENSKNPIDLLLNKYQVIHSSGTSGLIGYFVYSQADWARGYAQNTRPFMGRHRRKPGRYKAAFYGATRGHLGGISLFRTTQRPFFNWFIQSKSFDIGEPKNELINGLNRFNPDCLLGYTTAIKTLAKMKTKGLLTITPKEIITSGEPQSYADYLILKQAFGCDITNAYISCENLLMGYSRDGAEEMTLYDDHLIYEFEEDCTLVTNLFNYTLPLIRYRTSDVLRPVENDTSASPYIKVHGVVGRHELTPRFSSPTGTVCEISPMVVLSLHIRGVSKFKMIVLDHSSFEFQICLDGSLPLQEIINSTNRELDIMLSDFGITFVNYQVIAKPDLPVNPTTGKYQCIELMNT